MNTLCNTVLHHSLPDKDNRTTTDWEVLLTPSSQEYAARDVQAPLLIRNELYPLPQLQSQLDTLNAPVSLWDTDLQNKVADAQLLSIPGASDKSALVLLTNVLAPGALLKINPPCATVDPQTTLGKALLEGDGQLYWPIRQVRRMVVKDVHGLWGMQISL